MPKIKYILYFVILAASLQPLGAIPITSKMVDCASAAGKVSFLCLCQAFTS
jgi:hypothetical protein